MQRTKVGNVEVVSLNDNLMAFGLADVYPGATGLADRHSAHLDENGAVSFPFQSFLVIDGDTTVLVDTGWGPEMGGQLPSELAAAGVDPEAIDIVTFTHLHGDHIGWNIDRDSGAALFPKARFLVPQKDWDEFGGREDASFERDVRPLQGLGHLDLFDGERAISRSVRAIPTPGHTPGHTSFLITSGSARGCILGDVVLSPIDVMEPDLESSFDSHTAVAIRTRKQMIERLGGDDALVAASHLPVPGLGHFITAEGKRFWQGITLD